MISVLIVNVRNCSSEKILTGIQYSLPDCYKKIFNKCNSPGIFSGLVVFWAYFFENLKKIATCNRPGVSTVIRKKLQPRARKYFVCCPVKYIKMISNIEINSIV